VRRKPNLVADEIDRTYHDSPKLRRIAARDRSVARLILRTAEDA
jgi:hypothetical protein